LAAKDVDPEFYKEWKKRHHKARQDCSHTDVLLTVFIERLINV